MPPRQSAALPSTRTGVSHTNDRGSDGEEEEKGEPSATRASSFKDLFLDWYGPDLVFNTVSDWIHDFDGNCEK